VVEFDKLVIMGVGRGWQTGFCGRGGEFDMLVILGGGVEFDKLVNVGVVESLTNRLL
jgi:hypothetical protein